jgi:hypothetical protein
MANSTGLSFIQYDPSQSAATNSQNMVNNQNQNYQSFLSNLPGYQSSLNNQAIDQGNQQYNNEKQQIDTSANQRGLLYSGLKTGAEQGAANTAANNTQNQIASNNENLSNYATGYGNQVAQSNIGNYQGQVNAALQNYGFGLQQQGQNSAMLGGLLGGGLGLAGMAMFSDEDLKDDISDADKDSDKMISKLNPKSFKYKDDPDEETHYGIIAQDLEKSPMGKSLVIDTPKGKAIDIPRALAAVMAVQSTMDKRLKRKGA